MTTVMMPPHIMVDKCSTVPEALAAAATPQLKCTEVFMICIQLYHQIYAFHRRDKVIRDIAVNNVVSTLAGSQRRWTLLEYCAVAGVGAESNSVPVWQTPPEVCCLTCWPFCCCVSHAAHASQKSVIVPCAALEIHCVATSSAESLSAE